MGLLAKIASYVVVYSIALFYGILALFGLLVGAIRNRNAGPKQQRREMPSCLLNPEWGDHHFLRTDSNLRFHYVAKGDPAKPLMLFLHGFPEFWYSWRHQMKAFSDDYRVVAIDLRGYGDSDRPEGVALYKTSLLTNDIKEIIKALGYESCVLVGHDWGGLLAWSFAHQYPEYVQKLINMNAPHPSCFTKFMKTSWVQFKKSWYMFLFQLPYLPELVISQAMESDMFENIFKNLKGVTEEDIEAYKYAVQQSGLTGPINYYRNILDNGLPRGIYSNKITAPTLLIWGTEDEAIDRGCVGGTEKYAPNLSIRWVEGASHWVNMDEPELVNNFMREFLSN